MEQEGHYLLTYASENSKVGPIPVSISPKQTCPDSCTLKGNGCYSENFPLSIHWDQISRGDKGHTWPEFLDRVSRMKKNQLWRHNQAGDLPGTNEVIDVKALRQLVKANEGKRGFTFTRKPMTKANATAVAYANAAGFTINLSAHTLAEADRLAALGVGPVTVVLPTDSPRDVRTPEGRRVTMCPAQFKEYMTCAVCQMCQKSDRKSIVGFIAHGARKNTVNKVIMMKSIGNVTKEAA